MPGVMSEYLFAARKALLLDEYLLLDKQSLVHIMCNPVYLEKFQGLGQKMVLKSNEGRLPVNKVAGFEGFEKETWFSWDATTNILSFSLVRKEYMITYDRED